MFASIDKVAREQVTRLLEPADIHLNGSRPWDVQVKNDSFFSRVLLCGSLGLGESYMDRWWDCKALDLFFHRLLRHKLDKKTRSRTGFLNAIKAGFINCQSRRRAYEVGEKHYDAGNDLFEGMLDSNMIYSCGFWKDAENLEEAQTAKLEMICRKLRLEAGMKLLDIGCGWGGLAAYAARNFGVSVVGVTISKEQAELAQKRCRGLPVEIRLQDYREIDEVFDAVVSVGMFEHVGYKNYRQFMQVVRGCLKKDGLFLLHTIASNTTVRHCDPWFDKYIFPNGMLPSIKQLGAAIEEYFVMEDWQNIGVHYDQTLMAWYANFEKCWQQVKENYSDRFYRMWRYYLLSSAGGFRSRSLQVWQVVLSPEGAVGGYTILPAGMYEEEKGNLRPSSGKTRSFR